MSIHMCPSCDKMADMDFSSDDFIGDICISCIEDMDTEDLQKMLSKLGSFDQEFVREILAERATSATA